MISAQQNDIVKDFNNLNNPQTPDGLMELVQSYIKLHEEHQKLKRKLDEANSNQSTKEVLYFDGEVYFCEKNGRKDGPFCTGCFDMDGKLVRVHPREDANKNPIWLCKICDFEYLRQST